MQTTDHTQDKGPNQTDHTNGFSSNSSNPRTGNRKHPDPGKGFTITGADGAPIEIPAGEFYFNTKVRAKRMMQNHLTSEARQVYACLEVATMGFQQELAVTMDRGRKMNLRSEHICQQTGLSTPHVRRALAELEDLGLAERRSINGKSLTQGNIAIYSWAIPRQTAKTGSSRSQRSNVIFAKLSPFYPDLVSFAKSYKIRPPEDFNDESLEAARGYFDEAMVAVAEAQKAAEVAAAKLKMAFAQASANKDKEPERTSERTDEAGRQAEVQVKFEASLPACPPSDQENNSEHTTPPASTAAQILTLPSVRQLQQKLSDTIGPELLEKIVTQLGDGPLEEFDKRLLLKMASTKSLARLPSIAGDVRRAHALQIANQQAEAEIITRQRQEEEKRFIAQAKAEWHRYPEADRQMLRETYPEIEWG